MLCAVGFRDRICDVLHAHIGVSCLVPAWLKSLFRLLSLLFDRRKHRILLNQYTYILWLQSRLLALVLVRAHLLWNNGLGGDLVTGREHSFQIGNRLKLRLLGGQ